MNRKITHHFFKLPTIKESSNHNLNHWKLTPNKANEPQDQGMPIQQHLALFKVKHCLGDQPAASHAQEGIQKDEEKASPANGEDEDRMIRGRGQLSSFNQGQTLISAKASHGGYP